jgi:hypothetical protein
MQPTITSDARIAADGSMLAISPLSLITLGRCRIQLLTSPSEIRRMKREPSLIYSILIDDKAVVALEARGSDARELCKEERFLEELSYLESNGEPLYRPGRRIRARPATEEEWIRYDQACSADGCNADDIILVYLVDLDRE